MRPGTSVLVLVMLFPALIECQTCSSNTYLQSSGCVNCPTNSVSAPGSTLVTQCICRAGYNGPHGGPCSPCTFVSATLTCGGTCACSPMTGTGGTITDGPGAYQYLASCWWKITSSAVISWRFTMFDTEADFDKLTIYACTNTLCGTGKVLLGKCSGTSGSGWQGEVPPSNSIWSSQPASGRGTLSLEFYSDSSMNFEGFEGTWSIPNEAIGVCSSPTLCVADSYYSFTGTVGCQPCSSHSSSAAGSMAIEACVCNA